MRNAQRALIVQREHPLKTGRFYKSVANRRNDQISDYGIGLCQGLFNAAGVRAIGNIEFRCNFLTA